MSAAGSSPPQPPDIVPYPPELARAYRDAGYWGSFTIPQELHAAAQAHGDRPALATAEGRFTYSELDVLTDRLALGLNALGLRPGGRVILQLTNSAAAVVVWYGLLKAGLLPVATLAQHRRHEIQEIAGQTEPVAHIVQADFPSHDLPALAREVAEEQHPGRTLLTLGAARTPSGFAAVEQLLADNPSTSARALVEEIQTGIRPDDVAVMQLSGGTTSVPKVIPRLHAEYWYNARAYAEAIGVDGHATVAHVLPVVHNAGIVCGLHAAHSAGACFAVGSPDPEALKALGSRAKPTHMIISPPVALAIVADPELREALSSLTTVVWVLGPLADDVVASLETGDCRILQMFGMSEGLCLVTPRDTPVEIRHRFLGTTICPLDEARVYAPGTEEPVSPGTLGELCCRGPYTIRGYFRAPERNAEAFTSDGFYRTGDIVLEHVHEGRSYYALVDRIKDLINRGGEKINAQEIEQLLVAHPRILEAALVAVPDPRLGERACAVVVPRPGVAPPTLDELRVHLDRLGVAKFKWPERVVVRDSLPRTNIMKVDKGALRREITQPSADAPARARGRED